MDDGHSNSKKYWIQILVVSLLLPIVAGVATWFITTRLTNNQTEESIDAHPGQTQCSNEFPGDPGGWGPDRPTVGPSDYSTQPAFNIERNNPNYGDERTFATVREVLENGYGEWQNDIEVQAGHEYEVRVLVHNGARSSEEYEARGTRLTMKIAPCSGKRVPMTVYLTASNSYPLKIWDNIAFRSTEPIRMYYVSHSATLYSNGLPTPGVALPSEIITPNGTLIGTNSLDGNVGGDYKNIVYVYAKIKAYHA